MKTSTNDLIQLCINTIRVVAGLALIPLTIHAATVSVLKVGEFSMSPEGTELPEEWRPLIFKKVPKNTEYTVVREGETTVVSVRSRSTSRNIRLFSGDGRSRM